MCALPPRDQVERCGKNADHRVPDPPVCCQSNLAFVLDRMPAASAACRRRCKREAMSQTCQHMFAPLWATTGVGLVTGHCYIDRVHLCEHNGVKIIVLCILEVEILNIQVHAHQLSRIY